MIHPSAFLIVPLLLSVQEPADEPVVEDAEERHQEPSGEEAEASTPPVELLSMDYRGIDALMPSAKDARLLGALRMLDDRLAELPAELDESRIPPGALSLITRFAQGPLAMRVVMRDEPIAGMMAPIFGELRLPGGSSGEARSVEQDVFRLFEALGMSLQPPAKGELAVIPAPVPLWTGALGTDWVLRFGQHAEVGSPEQPRYLPAGAQLACSARFDYGAAFGMSEDMIEDSMPPAERAEWGRMVELFGLRDYAIEYSVGFDAERSYEIVATEGYRSVLEGMHLAPSGPLSPDRVAWIPEDASWAVASRLRWNGYVDFLEEFMGDVPGMDPYSLLEQARDATGIDLRKGLFEAIGEHFLMYGSDSTGGGGLLSTVTLIELKDVESFRTMLDQAQAFLLSELEGDARRYFRVEDWEHDELAFTSMRFAGLPVPLECTLAVVGDVAIFAATPQGAVAAARQVRGTPRSLLDSRALQDQLPGDMSTAIGLMYLDTARFLRDGYGVTSLLCSALANGVRSPEGSRNPGMILPTYRDLARDAKAFVVVNRFEGDAMVAEYRGDRSHLVNATGMLGWFAEVPGPLVAAVVMAGMANESEFQRGIQKAFGMAGDDDGLPTVAPTPAPTGGLDSREARAWNEIGEIQEALDAYAASNGGRFPASLEELARPDAHGNQFLPEAPVDPWGHPYEYVAPEDGDGVPYVWSKGIEQLHERRRGETDEGEQALEQFDREMHAFEVQRARTDLAAISSALFEYFIRNDRYPESLEVLVTPDENGHTYLNQREVPTDPWGTVYDYAPPQGEATEPMLRSLGADGKPGGTGMDADVHHED